MRAILMVGALALGLAPGIAAACDYGNEASESTAAPEQMASVAPPATAKATPAKVVKAAPSAVKPVATKTKQSASDQRVAAAPAN
ncbi:MAG TPA: hypothetical protein VKG21_08460 [Casimicrobiaceae bacterium]|nr:hypothetical protein [Casimicrobiaceae bacterium]